MLLCWKCSPPQPVLEEYGGLADVISLDYTVKKSVCRWAGCDVQTTGRGILLM